MTDDSETGDADGGSGRGLVPVLGVFVLFALTVAGAVALAPGFRDAGLRTFEDASSVGNSAFILVEILVVTLVFLAAQRFGFGMTLIRALLVLVFAISIQLAVGVAFSPLVSWAWTAAVPVAAVTAVVLWVYPEWYVVDAVAVVAGAAITAQLGISLGPLPVVVLLVAMALYDAFSVYVSGHMVELAQGVGEMKLPMVFVVPASLDFSLRDTDDLLDQRSEVAILGLGDAFFPGLLAVSGGVFLDAAPLVAGTILNLPAVGALLGGLVGMVALQYIATRIEGAHAGLPALNGGVLGGYLLGALAAGVPLAAAVGL